MSAAPSITYRRQTSRLGQAWFFHCVALGLHVADEALTGFLSVYNSSVRAIRPQGWWFPPTFTFSVWLSGLVLLVVVLLALTPWFGRNVKWVRPIGYFFAFVNISNALGHTLATIFGRTVNTVRFSRPAPGFYSSPLLLATAIYLLLQLVRSRERRSV